MLKIETITVGMHGANCYLVYDDEAREGVVIDPGDEPAGILKVVSRAAVRVTLVVLTHGHTDHTGGAAKVTARLKCPLAAHKKELPLLADPAMNHSGSAGRGAAGLAPDMTLSDGQVLPVGRYGLTVVHTPGHTPGGICLRVVSEALAFTGDTLFEDGCGRTDLPGGNSDQLNRSLKNKIFTWPEDTRLYPGHDGSCTLKEARRRLL